MTIVNERPDVIIYMSDSQKIHTDGFIEIFDNLEIKIPCILITDSNRTVSEEKLLISGLIKQHLVKPVSLKEISNAINLSLKDH